MEPRRYLPKSHNEAEEKVDAKQARQNGGLGELAIPEHHPIDDAYVCENKPVVAPNSALTGPASARSDRKPAVMTEQKEQKERGERMIQEPVRVQ